jgi:hypothetical protein
MDSVCETTIPKMISVPGRENKQRLALTPFDLFLACLFAAGLALRLGLAASTFLNPDEVLHYLASAQPSAVLAYKASLNIAHPPLLILLLHYVAQWTSSELTLRLPSVFAGLASCWVTYRWLVLVTRRTTAWIALAFLLFLPSLVLVSAEVRQYALLSLFVSLALYWFDLGMMRGAASYVALSGVALCLALLTHYSALIFALAHGLYALLRLYKKSRKLIVVWIGWQLAALLLAGFLMVSQVSQLEAQAVPQKIAKGMVAESIFQPDHENALRFAVKANVRFFHYVMWNQTIGILTLILFISGIVLLCREPQASGPRPSPRQLALLLLAPLLITMATAYARKYPYGGTRHDCLLIIFAVVGFSITLSRLLGGHERVAAIGIAVCLAVVNIFPSPIGPHIRFQDQKISLMRSATGTLAASLPHGSTIVADQQSALLLSYYFCHSQPMTAATAYRPQLFACGAYDIVPPEGFIYNGKRFSDAMRQRAGLQNSSGGLWFFQAGWGAGLPDLRAQLARYGCPVPKTFGENILLCRLAVRR